MNGRPYFDGFDPAIVPSPAYVVDLAAVRANLTILRDVADISGATMLIALKAFALPATFGLIREYLDGACASGPYEARLARDEIGRGASTFEVHTHGPAYTPATLAATVRRSDHIVFNTFGQWVAARPILTQRRRRALSVGVRVNPATSLGAVPIYDPAGPGSRLGMTRGEFDRQRSEAQRSTGRDPLDEISGLHMHVLCEQGAGELAIAVATLEEAFGDVLADGRIAWLNLGGGHLITADDYDRERLVQLVRHLADRYGVRVILEPGEAIAIRSGILVTTVLDTIENDGTIAILDTSATAHMPDTLEMPYRPAVWHDRPDAPHAVRFGGMTCLAGDVIGDTYRFDRAVAVGDRIVFDDMAHYTMVKTSSFNGIALPTIATWDSDSRSLVIRRSPSWADFRDRLG